jgi:LacI family transcriptional regulator
LATGKSKVLGVLLPYAEAFTDDNPFCAQVTNGILQEVVKHNYNLMLYTGVWSNGDHVEMGIDSRVDGVVLVMPPSNSPVFLKCEARHIPYVSILREPIAGTRTVNSDDFKGGVFATDHLISMGHKRIAHLVGDEEVCTTRPRREGYLHALAEAGIASDKNLMIKGGFNWRQGYEAAKALLDLPSYKRPTAVFAANDLCADGAMRAFREAGVRIPDDMSVVGYDDTWFATMTQPALTSVRMPIVEMGALAIQLLVNQVERRESVDPHPVLPVSLTVRNSCGGRPAPPDQTF